MNTCVLSGIFGLSFLGGSLYTMSVSREQMNMLIDVLSPEAAMKYVEIVNERRDHYLQGIVLGIVVSYLIVMNTKISNRYHRISLIFGITLLIASLYYILMPKSDYMLNHLRNDKENAAWLEMYKTMKIKYHMGFVLGALAAIPLGNAFC